MRNMAPLMFVKYLSLPDLYSLSNLFLPDPVHVYSCIHARTRCIVDVMSVFRAQAAHLLRQAQVSVPAQAPSGTPTVSTP